jgi:hypothetical protein
MGLVLEREMCVENKLCENVYVSMKTQKNVCVVRHTSMDTSNCASLAPAPCSPSSSLSATLSRLIHDWWRVRMVG